jgi:hypothetical protein
MARLTSLYVVVALLVSRGLGSFLMRVVKQNQRNSYECGLSHSKVDACASYMQLASIRSVTLLLSPFVQSLTIIMIHLS